MLSTLRKYLIFLNILKIVNSKKFKSIQKNQRIEINSLIINKTY